MPKYEFSENNSGGSWWLNKEQYLKLFAAGWSYVPSDFDKERGYDQKGFAGDKSDTVPWGWRHNTQGEFATIREAVESFETTTGEDFFAEGCNCCGVPFSISSVYEAGVTTEYISGNDAVHSYGRPW